MARLIISRPHKAALAPGELTHGQVYEVVHPETRAGELVLATTGSDVCGECEHVYAVLLPSGQSVSNPEWRYRAPKGVTITLENPHD